MTSTIRPVRIGVFGHYGNRNLGDEAIIAAAVESIRRRYPDALIRLFSLNPRDTATRYALAAHPVRATEDHMDAYASRPPESVPDRTSLARLAGRARAVLRRMPPLYAVLRGLRRLADGGLRFLREIRFLKRIHGALRDLDLLLIAGSNQFLDNFGGPWGYPYDLLKWSAIARLLGVKVAYASVGAGPLDAPLSKRLVRAALRFSDYTSFRDAASAHLVKSLGFAGPPLVYPDLAFSLHLPKGECRGGSTGQDGGRPSVGINPMPMYDPRYWCAPDASRYETYVARLAAFCDALARDHYPLRFFGTQARDEGVIQDVLSHMATRAESGYAIHVDRAASVDELLHLFGGVDLMVATRFHGTLLALLAGTPVVSICYYRKSRDLMREMGQEAYAVDFDTFSPDELVVRFRALEKNRRHEATRIARCTHEYRAMLDQQYDTVFGLLAPPLRKRPSPVAGGTPATLLG